MRQDQDITSYGGKLVAQYLTKNREGRKKTRRERIGSADQKENGGVSYVVRRCTL